jgi:hypothetical protein
MFLLSHLRKEADGSYGGGRQEEETVAADA